MYSPNMELDYDKFNKAFPIKTQETIVLFELLKKLEEIRCGLIDIEETISKKDQ